MRNNLFALTKRELEVLCLLGAGKETREIADILKLRPSTIDGYITTIRYKLLARNRTNAVVNALRLQSITFEQIPDEN